MLIDRSPWHEYRPSYLWVMTGKREPDDVRRELSMLTHRYGTAVVEAEVTGIDPDARRVETGSGGFDYDYLIVALGAELVDRSRSPVSRPPGSWTTRSRRGSGSRASTGAASWSASSRGPTAVRRPRSRRR